MISFRHDLQSTRHLSINHYHPVCYSLDVSTPFFDLRPNSGLEDPSWMTIAELQVLNTVVESVCLRVLGKELLFLLVLLLQPPPQQVDHNDVHHQVAERKAVAQNISRCRVRSVQLRTQNSSEIANGDLHGVGGRTLGLARDIDSRPTEHQGNRGVDSNCCKECSNV